MKRKKKRLVEEFEKLLQEVIPGSYFKTTYKLDTINLWWWDLKEPRIDIDCGNGHGYTIHDFSKTPLPILKVLVKELTKREKIKRKTN